jgi:hypothetical protein
MERLWDFIDVYMSAGGVLLALDIVVYLIRNRSLDGLSKLMEQRAIDCGTSPADAATRVFWHNAATCAILWPRGLLRKSGS